MNKKWDVSSYYSVNQIHIESVSPDIFLMGYIYGHSDVDILP